MMLKVQRQARDRKLDIIGVYHSHPDHPAIPSEWRSPFSLACLLLRHCVSVGSRDRRLPELATG